MAYIFKLPQTVTEEIMRYAIGYPCDRIRAMVAGLRREETRNLPEARATYRGVCWYHRSEFSHRSVVEMGGAEFFMWKNDPSVDLMEYDKKRRLRLLQEQCEPCEPTELELQRMYF